MEQTFGFPPVDGFYNSLRKLDYVKLGEDFIFILATICAVVVGVVSYAYTAFQLYWNDNGESIVNSITTNTNRVVDFLFGWKVLEKRTVNELAQDPCHDPQSVL